MYIMFSCPEIIPGFWLCISQSLFHFAFLITIICLNFPLQKIPFTLLTQWKNMMRKVVVPSIVVSNIVHGIWSSRLSVSTSFSKIHKFLLSTVPFSSGGSPHQPLKTATGICGPLRATFRPFLRNIWENHDYFLALVISGTFGIKIRM